jgi:hypothetical protein
VRPVSASGAGLVLVRDPVLDGRVERRCDDEDLGRTSLGAALDLLAQRPAADRLVRDHEDAVRMRRLFVHLETRPRRRRLLPVPARDGADDDDRGRDA